MRKINELKVDIIYKEDRLQDYKDNYAKDHDSYWLHKIEKEEASLRILKLLLEIEELKTNLTDEAKKQIIQLAEKIERQNPVWQGLVDDYKKEFEM